MQFELLPKALPDNYHVDPLSATNVSLEVDLEPWQTFNMELFAKIINTFQPVTIFAQKLDLKWLIAF